MYGEADHPPPLLRPLLHTPVVLPGHHLHLPGAPVRAVGGGDHVARAQHGPAAEMEVVLLPPEADLEWNGVRFRLLATNNPAALREICESQGQARQEETQHHHHVVRQ